VVTVLLIAAWLCSGWWQLDWQSATGRRLEVARGQIMYWRYGWGGTGQPTFTGWYLRRVVDDSTGQHAFGMWWRGPGINRAFASVPLLLLAGTSLAMSAVAGRLDTLARRARLNLCSKCHYDRTGLPVDAVCPECGAAASGSTSS
jgi:hypothetical protein